MSPTDRVHDQRFVGISVCRRTDGAQATLGKSTFLGPSQNLAVSLVFEVMEEERYNRTMEDYERIKARLPPLKVLLHVINEKLAEWHREGRMLGAICDFKANDEAIHYRPDPRKISMETLRSGLELCGMRDPEWRRSPGADPNPPFPPRADLCEFKSRFDDMRFNPTSFLPPSYPFVPP